MLFRSMTNYQPELELFFEPGKDLVIFETQEDLVRKADYYLEHEEERLEIAQNGFEKVRQYHSYRQRMTQMLEILESITI